MLVLDDCLIAVVIIDNRAQDGADGDGEISPREASHCTAEARGGHHYITCMLLN